MSRRVVHVINNLPVGGAERFVGLLAEAEQHAGWDVEVVALTPPVTLGAELAARGVPLHCLRKTRLNDPLLVLDLARWLRRRPPDVVHTHLFYADTFGRIAARCSGVPAIVSTEHSTEGMRLSRRRRAMMRVTAPLAHRLVAVSESVLQAAIPLHGRPAEVWRVIPNGIAVEDWTAATPLEDAAIGLPRDALCVGCTGRLAPEKGYDVLVDAIARLDDARVHLVFAGDGDCRAALAAQASARGLAGRVHFLGWRDDVPRLVQRFDVFAMPSLYEGLSLALLEAMAAGRACVVSEIPELVDVLGTAGWTARRSDPEDWRRVLHAVLAAPGERRARGAAASRAAARFSIAASAAAYIRLYLEVLAAHEGRSVDSLARA